MAGDAIKADNEAAPQRSALHEALAVFLGNWRAQGTSHGEGGSKIWESTHSARWHTGEFFLIQDERADIEGAPFDTLSIMGVDPKTRRHFARSFENHGFYRHYDVDVVDRVWTLSGEFERARIEFSADQRKQTIVWEFRPEGPWIALCERTATRED